MLTKLILLAVLMVVGVCAWRLGEGWSNDALNLAVGILFGILAGLPTALLVLASGRRREDTNSSQPGRETQRRLRRIEEKLDALARPAPAAPPALPPATPRFRVIEGNRPRITDQSD